MASNHEPEEEVLSFSLNALALDPPSVRDDNTTLSTMPIVLHLNN
jgi:hypothetical protein